MLLDKSVDSYSSNRPAFKDYYRSLFGQNLIYTSIWLEMELSFLRYPHQPQYWDLSINNLIPHSARGLMYAHWITGRKNLNKIYMYQKYGFEFSDLLSESVAAIYNYNRAMYYIRQLAGNDQEIMFPFPSMVLFDVWRVLNLLISCKGFIKVSNRKYHDKISAGFELCDSLYEYSVLFLKDCLIEDDSAIGSCPENYFDYKSISRLAKDELLLADRFSDVTSRVRTDALRTKSYLYDDYEDPRFHLDWTLAQMHSSFANVYISFIEASENRLMKECEEAEKKIKEN